MRSTTTTTIHSTDYKDTFLFIKDKKGITFTGHVLNFSVDKKFKKDEPGLIDLCSDQKKVFISLSPSFYHLYHDHIGEFLYQYEANPDAKFIIDISAISHIEKLPEHVKMFFKFLNDNHVDYRPIDFKVSSKVNIDNFYIRNVDAESFELNDPCNKLYDFAQSYIIDKDIVPDKKVYISRKNFRDRDLSFLIKDSLPYKNDDRLDNEEIVEEYFRSLGFEIVVPEDFETFEDQINYFYKAKMVVSATSSGLTNACFMQKGGVMVEFATPLISFNSLGDGVTSPRSCGQEEIHHFYHMLSIARGHNYISIPNMTRDSQKIIDTIENSNMLKNIFTE